MTTKLLETLTLAEEALESVHGLSGINMSKPLSAIREQKAELEKQAEQVAKFIGGYQPVRNSKIGLPQRPPRYPSGKPENCTAPVRTKDLTDAELRQVLDRNCGDGLMAIARAGIAADRKLNNVDSVDTSLERVEKTAKSIHIAPSNSCQKPTELVETDCGGAQHHRYAGSFGD